MGTTAATAIMGGGTFFKVARQKNYGKFL